MFVNVVVEGVIIVDEVETIVVVDDGLVVTKFKVEDVCALEDNKLYVVPEFMEVDELSITVELDIKILDVVEIKPVLIRLVVCKIVLVDWIVDVVKIVEVTETV